MYMELIKESLLINSENICDDVLKNISRFYNLPTDKKLMNNLIMDIHLTLFCIIEVKIKNASTFPGLTQINPTKYRSEELIKDIFLDSKGLNPDLSDEIFYNGFTLSAVEEELETILHEKGPFTLWKVFWVFQKWTKINVQK